MVTAFHSFIEESLLKSKTKKVVHSEVKIGSWHDIEVENRLMVAEEGQAWLTAYSEGGL